MNLLLKGFREFPHALHGLLKDFPGTLRLPPILQIRILEFWVLEPALHQVELGGQPVLRLDLLQGLYARLRDLVVMPLMITIRYDVELSCLHCAVWVHLCCTASHRVLLLITSFTFVA
jgi:hypothetical protein